MNDPHDSEMRPWLECLGIVLCLQGVFLVPLAVGIVMTLLVKGVI